MTPRAVRHASGLWSVVRAVLTVALLALELGFDVFGAAFDAAAAFFGFLAEKVSGEK